MIMPRMTGGLGNQMFQIAAGYALAAANGGEFAVNYAIPHACAQGFHPAKYKDTLFSKVPFTTEPTSPDSIYWKETTFHYEPIPYYKDMIYEGTFQSDKHFKDYKHEINKLFRFPGAIRDKVDDALEAIDAPIVGMHVRRGDYQLSPDKHTQYNLDYYKKAMANFDDDVVYIICTDDPATVTREFADCGFNYILSNSTDELEDMYLMSQCNDLVICNSTFSWWAAYLGVEKNSVYCPKAWFGPDGPQDYEDIYVKEWIRI